MIILAAASGSLETSIWFRVISMLFLAIGLYMIVTETAKSKTYKQGTTITKKTTKKNNMTSRIEEAMKETNKKLAVRKDFYQNLGQDVPMGLQLQQSIVDTAIGKSGSLNILILLIAGIVSLVQIIFTYRFMGLLSVILALTTLSVAFIVTSAITISGEHAQRKKALNVLTVLHSQYQNTSNFLSAVTLARDVFMPGTYEYKVLNSYYDRVHNLNMTSSVALKMLVDDLDNNVNIKQYMELVEQAETIDASYKDALEGIPANLKSSLDNRDVYIRNTQLTAGFMAVTWLILMYCAVLKVVLTPGAYELISDPNNYQFFGTGVIGFTSLSVILALSNRVKPRENWGAGK